MSHPIFPWRDNWPARHPAHERRSTRKDLWIRDTERMALRETHVDVGLILGSGNLRHAQPCLCTSSEPLGLRRASASRVPDARLVPSAGGRISSNDWWVYIVFAALDDCTSQLALEGIISLGFMIFSMVPLATEPR